MYFRKNLRRLMVASVIVSSLIFTPEIYVDELAIISVAHAEIKTYEGIGEYVMSDFETPEVAKQRAKVRAEQNAQEQAGVYVSGYTKVNNLQVTNDEVIVITNGIMSVIETTYEKKFGTDDTTIYIAKIKANINTDDVNKWLEKGIQERSTLAAQNQELQKAIEEQNKQIEELKRQLNNKSSETDLTKLKVEISQVDNAFMSNQKIETGNRFYFNGNYENAILEYTQAIELYSKNTIAYRNRGAAYANLHEYARAASDYGNAIELESNNELAYIGRSAAYIYLQEYNKAIKDLTKAISLNPYNPMSYYNRAICYQKIGNNEKAQLDFARAKEL